MTKNEWQPIETAPKDGTPFLIEDADGWVQVCIYSDWGCIVRQADFKEVGDAVYWQHLPQSSKDERTDLCKRKINTLLETGEYKQIHGATVLVNKDGHIAVVNGGGAFYWAENEAIKWEYMNANR